MQSNAAFRLMSWKFRLRDWLHPPLKILQEAGVRLGMTVLDFGCGPGGFSLAAARLAGPQGRVYALDIHPLAIRSVQRGAARQGLGNIQAILGSDMTQVPEASVDVVLLYDVLHHLSQPIQTLGEIRRVLKPDGALSVSDHHLIEPMLLSMVANTGLFRLVDRGRSTFRFEPSAAREAAS